MDPVLALERIAYLLERDREPTYRVRAFRNAAAAIGALTPDDLERRAKDGTLRQLSGIGEKTESIVLEALKGTIPSYLEKLEGSERSVTGNGGVLRAALKGDCHTHSDWSDGGSPIETMARAAIDIGHEYIVLTDHSPRLTIANGLSRERLEEQLQVVDKVNSDLAPFRILTGIEVDILEDGGIDQDDDLLERLDLVVASVHSKLRMEEKQMTLRMATAIANPHVDVLGHCTGRLVVGRERPQSTFNPELVFTACKDFGTALEINSRLERQDPPDDLLSLAVEMELMFTIDTDAHALGQLEWLELGCERAERCGVTPEMVLNTNPAEDLLTWTNK